MRCSILPASVVSVLACAIALLAPSAAFAQSANCAKPYPVGLGDTPFANLSTFTEQLSQSTSGFGESMIYKTGWFAFTPDVTAQYIIGVCGANDDSKLALAADCPLAPDSLWDVLGFNDDACAFAGGSGLWASKLYPGNAGRSLDAQLVAGHTYLIAVGGYGASTQPVTGSLSIDFVPPPLDACAAATVGVIGTNPLAMNTTAPALTVECGGVSYDISKTNYLRFTAPYTGEFIANSCAQNIDTVMAVLTACGDGTTSLICNDDTCGGGSSVRFSANSGQELFIAVGLYSPNAIVPALLSIAIEEVAPPLDPCASIVSIGVGSNVIALESALPHLVVGTNPPTTIYRVNYTSFTAPQAGVYTVSNCTNADFDSWLLLTTQCNSGPAVTAIDDDGCGVIGGPSRLQFFSEAGATTIIGIGAWSEVTALAPATSLTVAFVAPPADPCAAGNVIDGAVGSNTVPMSIAYRALNLAGHCDLGPSGNDAIACARLIRFTAAVDGVHSVGNCADTDPAGNGRVDARLAVLTDCGDPASVLVCDDDGCTAGAAPYTAHLVFTAIAGRTYYIAAGGFDESVTGPLHVVIEQPAPPTNPADLNQDGVISGADLAILLGNWQGTTIGDINRDGLVNGADLAILLNSWT